MLVLPIKDISLQLELSTPWLKQTDWPSAWNAYGLLDTFKFVTKVSIYWNFESNRLGPFWVLALKKHYRT